MRVTKTAFPEKSVIKNHLPIIHYADCFKGEMNTSSNVQLTSIARFLLNYNPAWIVWLMKLRNCLVKPFGLQTGEGMQPVLAIRKGEKAGFFDMIEVNDEEILLYATDKHLSACLSIMLISDTYKYNVMLSTTVCYHNLFGRIYFFFIKPFHIVIIKSMITSVINKFSLNNKNKLS